MKRIYKYSIAGLATLIASSGAAQADPVTALAAVFVSLGVGAATATILSAIVISIGLSLVSSLLAPHSKQAQSQQQATGMNTTLQSGGIVPRSFLFGQYATSGSEFYPARTWGEEDKTPNAYFTRFIALSDLPISGLVGLIVDGKECTYGAGSPDANLGYAIPEYSLSGKDHMWVKFHDGNQTTCDSYFQGLFAGDPDFPYESTMVGKGVAYVIVTALINSQLFSSFPQYRFITGGASFYDPRADSTAGGFGLQRWATPSTWAVTQNPAVIKYNILRGISYNGVWLYGLQGTNAGRLPYANWAAAMNVCDNMVEYDGTNSVAQFAVSGEITVNSSPADVLDELNKSDNGRLTENGGVFKTRSGPVGSAVMAFTDADLITTEQKSFDQFPGLEEAINGVQAQYPEPDQLWTMTDAAPLYDTSLEAQDGGRRLVVNIQYNFVTLNSRLQFLMKSARDEGRKFRKHVVVAGPQAQILEAFDVVSWTSVENGYSNKLFTAIPTDQANLDTALVLLEVDPADYDWDPVTDYQAFTPIVITGRPVPSQSMEGWAAAGIQITGSGGRKLAAIEIDWTTSGIDGVNGVQWEVYDNSCPGNLVVAGETDAFYLGKLYIATNIVGETSYQVRGRYRPQFDNRAADWSSLINVTTPKTQLAGNDLQDALLTYAKFAASIKPVQVSNIGLTGSPPGFSDVVTEEGAQVVDTTTGKLYTFHSGSWGEVGQGATDFSDLTGTILANQFSTTIRPIEVLGTLPTTGNFDGRQVFLTTDKKVYRFDNTNSPGQFIKSVDGADITANSIVSGQITAGAIGTTQLSAQAVTASKLLVSDTSNLILDSNIEDLSYWYSNESPTPNAITIVTPGVSSPGDWLTKNALAITANVGGEVNARNLPMIQCQPGDQFYMSAQVACIGGNATAYVYAVFYNRVLSDTSAIAFTLIGSTNSHSVVQLQGSVIAPAGATGVRIQFSIPDDVAGNSPHTVGYFAAPIVKRKGTGQLIVDGSITATKMSIGDTSNLVIDNQMVDINAWSPWLGTGTIKDSGVTSGAGNSTWNSKNVVGWQTISGQATGIYSQLYPCVAGQTYYFSEQVYQASGSGTIYLYACFFDKDLSNFDNENPTGGTNNTTATGTIVTLSGSWTAPANTKYVAILAYQPSGSSTGIQCYVGAPVIRLMYGGSLIVDGSISSTELATGSVVAGKIAAGAINVDTLIANNVVVTGHLVDNSVTQAQSVTQVGTAQTGSSASKTVLCSATISMPSGNGFVMGQVVSGASTVFSGTGFASTDVFTNSGLTSSAGFGVPNVGGSAGVIGNIGLYIPGSGSTTFYLACWDSIGGGKVQNISGWVLKVTQFVK